ncbi:MAG: hypothetical protein Q9159_006321 [Coniocarpon cinnabarinum]
MTRSQDCDPAARIDLLFKICDYLEICLECCRRSRDLEITTAREYASSAEYRCKLYARAPEEESAPIAALKKFWLSIGFYYPNSEITSEIRVDQIALHVMTFARVMTEELVALPKEIVEKTKAMSKAQSLETSADRLYEWTRKL